jgi:signal transduction histidine kinase
MTDLEAVISNAVRDPVARRRVTRALRAAGFQVREVASHAEALRLAQANGNLILEEPKRRHFEEQLRQAQKMEVAGRLAGGLAHDFGNLLTIISGYSQMVMDQLPARDPLRKDLEAVLEAAARGTALVRQLLTFSRRQPVEARILDLNRLVSRMRRMLQRVLGADIELDVALQPELGRIKADPGQIEQVILNLTVNARDAMPKGGRLGIRTSQAEAGSKHGRKRPGLSPRDYILLEISDTGTGMDAQTKSRLFEPFFTTKAKGTGLGLATVYGIVRQGAGDIEVETELGKGTSFRIYLPTAPEAARGRAPARPAILPRGTETILLVEDEAEVRRYARKMLVQQGYKVLAAGSAPEALRVWKRQRGSIDMLLTDVIMPQMSGHELAEDLKARRPDLKVLYISGYTDDVIARHGILDTETELLQKPFTPQSLGRKVRSLFDAPG